MPSLIQSSDVEVLVRMEDERGIEANPRLSSPCQCTIYRDGRNWLVVEKKG